MEGTREDGERVPIEYELVVVEGTVRTKTESMKIETLIPSLDIASCIGSEYSQGSSGVSIQVSKGPTVNEA